MGAARASWLAACAIILATAGVSQTAAPPAPPASSDVVQRGAYLAAVGDCASCHDRPGGEPFAGGRGLNTPFGVIYSANITPDAQTGIGAWSEADFYRAMHVGRDDGHHHLYPAFPYPYFTRASRADVDAIRAFLMTVKPVNYRPPANKLPFPLTIRGLVGFWNWLYFKPGDYVPVAGRSEQWNRGRYIVTGLGHCGACHTPKTALGGDKRSDALEGGKLDNWFAPDLAGDRRGGLGGWSAADIVEFLHTGRNARSSASGSMSDVIVYSTSRMSPDDLAAIAVYLKSLPARAGPPAPRLDPQVMARGKAIYVDECSACHKMDGSGAPGFFPPLGGDANVQSSDPTTIDRFILAGARSTPTDARPTPLTMPAFAWKLDDDEVAAVATYIRNAFGNSAAPVSGGAVKGLRGKVAAHPIRKPPAKV